MLSFAVFKSQGNEFRIFDTLNLREIIINQYGCPISITSDTPSLIAVFPGNFITLFSQFFVAKCRIPIPISYGRFCIGIHQCNFVISREEICSPSFGKYLIMSQWELFLSVHVQVMLTYQAS
jgi:hypothetical protein